MFIWALARCRAYPNHRRQLRASASRAVQCLGGGAPPHQAAFYSDKALAPTYPVMKKHLQVFGIDLPRAYAMRYSCNTASFEERAPQYGHSKQLGIHLSILRCAPVCYHII